MLAALQKSPASQQQILAVHVPPPEWVAEGWRLGRIQSRNNQERLGKWTIFAWVAPDTANTLENEVDGGEIGDHPIEIQVQALLSDLRRYQDLPAFTGARLTEDR